MSTCITCGHPLGSEEPHTFHVDGCAARASGDMGLCLCGGLDDCCQDCCPTCNTVAS